MTKKKGERKIRSPGKMLLVPTLLHERKFL